MEKKEIKKGHPAVGIVLGIIGIVAALPLAFMGGVVGGCICALLGIIAIIIGVRANRGGRRGGAAVVFGVIAVIVAVLMTFLSISVFKLMHDKAAESGVAPLVEKYAEDPYFGLMGIVSKIPQDEGTVTEFIDQLNQLNDLTESQLPANAN